MTEWNISGSLVELTEIDEEESLCSPHNQALNIFVAHRFRHFNYTHKEGAASLVNAMDTCTKISREGNNLTEITSTEQFMIWHNSGNNNEVYLQTYHSFIKVID